ncbi:MAG TPA: DUF4383 domain-containing protein [Candidatus Limnocylindrales bacterium]|nr:DUF4383 domain-containing protein [Candidatus Limnocylindrales bacterium]
MARLPWSTDGVTVEAMPAIRRLALGFGLVYLGATVLGILPPIGGTLGTQTSWVLHVAPVNLSSNVLHAAIAFLGILASGRNGTSRAYARVMGLFLCGIGVLGLVHDNPWGLIPLGGVMFVLHLLTGGLALYYGFAPED